MEKKGLVKIGIIALLVLLAFVLVFRPAIVRNPETATATGTAFINIGMPPRGAVVAETAGETEEETDAGGAG